MEVPEQSNNTISPINNESDSNSSINQQYSTTYVIPQPQRQRSEQQQLLLVK